MGNLSNEKDNFYMHIRFIGSNIDRIYKYIENSDIIKNLVKFWDIDPLQKNIDSSTQINAYFDSLQIKKSSEGNEDITLRECLILKVSNTFDPEVNNVKEKMEKLGSNQYKPLVLILTLDYTENKKLSDLIFIENYTEEPEEIEEKIIPKFLRFCSIHNGLGDLFYLNRGKNENESFDLIEREYPFNLNLACIGQIGTGKSSGANQILQEYKAKESNKGCSETKTISFYHVSNKPIRILDIPGFEDAITVDNVVKEFKKFRQNLEKLDDYNKELRKENNDDIIINREYIHIILYFLNFGNVRAFKGEEYPIFEEISHHKSAKIIYVLTFSSEEDPDQSKKDEFIHRINSGLKGLEKKGGNTSVSFDQYKANENNIVFVNFYYNSNYKVEPFGKKKLFKKIHDFFVESDFYKAYSKLFSNKEKIEKLALAKREKAKNLILQDKIFGTVSGVIPYISCAIQKYYFKRNIVRKIGQIFGFDVNLIKTNKKEEHHMKKDIGDDIYYKTPNLTNNQKGIYVHNTKLTKESNEFKAKDAIVSTCSTISYIGGGKCHYERRCNEEQFLEMSKKASELFTKGDGLKKEADKVWKITNFLTGKADRLIKEGTNLIEKSKNCSSAGAAFNSSAQAFKYRFWTLSVVGVLVGIGFSYYDLNTFSEELLDQFVDYYKNNSDKIKDSYEEAANYFLN